MKTVMMLSLMMMMMMIIAASAQQKRSPPQFPGLPTIDPLIDWTKAHLTPGYSRATVAEQAELGTLGGHRATNYEVITEDGYSLWLHRLGNSSGPPVLLQHGILVAADSWIVRGRSRKDLAFILLSNGFDVWLSNQRGTVYNQYSLKYPKNDARFWDFSIDEAAYYDLPAVIDTILEVRSASQIFFVGHSLGTVTLLGMAATRPEYVRKVRAAALLSPVVVPLPRAQLPPFLRVAVDRAASLYSALKESGNVEIAPRTEDTIRTIRELCRPEAPTQDACLELFGLFSGEHRTNLDLNDVDLFLQYAIAGISLKVLYHYFGQLIPAGQFQKYDYGPEENLVKYCSLKPPVYNLSLVTFPVALFWSYNDPYLSQETVERTAKQLPNVVQWRPVEDPRFTHNDMVIGDNAAEVVYPEVMAVLKAYV